jgi:hypothetical protein
MASDYKVFDGTDWLDPCKREISFLKKDMTFETLDPKNKPTHFFDGVSWRKLECPECICAPGYVVDGVADNCYKVTYKAANYREGAVVYELIPADNAAYGSKGLILYQDITLKTFPLNGFKSAAGDSLASYLIKENAGTGAQLAVVQTASNNFPLGGNRLRACGLWAKIPGSSPVSKWPDQQWLTVEYCINITEKKQYIFAIAGDNQIKASIDSTTFNGGGVTSLINLWGGTTANGSIAPSACTQPFTYWHMFPITLPVGSHTLILSGYNYGDAGSFGAEIYDCTATFMKNTLMAGLEAIDQYIIFSTKQLIVPPPQGPLVIAGPTETNPGFTCPDPTTTYSECYGAPACVKLLTLDCGEAPPFVLDCSTAITAGVYIANTPVVDGTIKIQYTGGTGQEYPLTTSQSTGVTGLTATLPAGVMNQGDGILTFNVTGTPSAGGTISFAIEILGQTCTVDITGDNENTVNVNFLADYIVLTYNFIKPQPGQPADSWIMSDGSDFYDTPYTVSGVNYVVRNDIQGIDLDTHTRIYAGPDQNNPILTSQYIGYNAAAGPYPQTTDLGGGIPQIIAGGNGTIPLDDQGVLRWCTDNTGPSASAPDRGQESVIINVKEFIRRFGPGGTNVGTANAAVQIATAVTNFNVEMRAWWYPGATKDPSRYPVKMKAEFYKGTPSNPITEVKCVNFNWVIVGGTSSTINTPPVIVFDNLNIVDRRQDLYYNSDGFESTTPPLNKRINVFSYDTLTGAGAFINNNTSLNPLVPNVRKPSNI